MCAQSFSYSSSLSLSFSLSLSSGRDLDLCRIIYADSFLKSFLPINCGMYPSFWNLPPNLVQFKSLSLCRGCRNSILLRLMLFSLLFTIVCFLFSSIPFNCLPNTLTSFLLCWLTRSLALAIQHNKSLLT